MTGRSAEFFASREEQLTWLRGLATREALWCLLERPRIRQFLECSLEQISIDGLGNEFSASRIYLGARSISPGPVWMRQADFTRLDFTGSLALLYEPSILIRQTIVAGRISIMSPKEYAERDLDDRKFVNWFQKVKRSLLRALQSDRFEVFIQSEDGRRIETRGIVASASAFSLFESGCKLKQFPESNVSFAIASRRPMEQGDRSSESG